LNVDMDLAAFERINPCGYQGLQVTQLSSLGVIMPVQDAAKAVVLKLADQLDLRLEFND